MPVGRTKDAGWQIGVSRTVHQPLGEVWDLLTGPVGSSIWLGAGVAFPAEPGEGYETTAGTTGEVRSYQERRRIRLTWHPADWSHDSTVQITLQPTPSGTSIRFHQDRLADAAERERQRDHWRAVLDRIIAELPGR